MLASGIAALREVLQTSCAAEIVYRSAADGAKTLRAVPGRTTFRQQNEYGSYVRVTARDFIVPASLLDSEPRPGDEIDFLGRTYEVLAPNGEPCWRWSDAFHTARRIHTKLIGGDV